MSASVRVESGIAAGTNYWIDRPVMRIGSDPQCDICLPSAELEPHALTLEFRGGGYRLYNRGSAPVRVGRSVVQVGENGPWNEAESVLLPGNLQIVLALDGDPRPSPRPEFRQDDEPVVSDVAAPAVAATDAAGQAAEKKKSAKTMLQLGVIGFCVLGMVAMLTMNKGEATVSGDRPTFAALVRGTLAKPADDPMRAFLPQLQYAQAAVVRGNRTRAKARFLKLRDQLVRQIETLPEKNRADGKRMLGYVEHQLSELQ